jgi:hypothetical protein
LDARGALDVIPSHYSQFPAVISNDTLPCHGVLQQLSIEGRTGTRGSEARGQLRITT